MLGDKAEVVHDDAGGMLLRSTSVVLAMPSVIRLRRYVRVPYRSRVPLTRGALFHDVQFGVLGRLRDAGLLPVRPAVLEEAFQILDSVLDAEATRSSEQLAPAIPRVWKDEIDGLRQREGVQALPCEAIGDLGDGRLVGQRWEWVTVRAGRIGRIAAGSVNPVQLLRPAVPGLHRRVINGPRG